MVFKRNSNFLCQPMSQVPWANPPIQPPAPPPNNTHTFYCPWGAESAALPSQLVQGLPHSQSVDGKWFFSGLSFLIQV